MTSEQAGHEARASEMRHYRLHLAAQRLSEQALICHAVTRHAESGMGPAYEGAMAEYIRTFEAAVASWRREQAQGEAV